jgi:hypothetical protein
LPSLGVTSPRQRAFPGSEQKRRHECAPAEASSTRAVLQSRPICAKVEPMECVPMVLSGAGSELLRPWSQAGLRGPRCFVECSTDEGRTHFAIGGLELGGALAWASRFLLLSLSADLWTRGILRGRFFSARGMVDMGRARGSARLGLTALSMRRSGRVWPGNSARTIDAGGRRCVRMPCSSTWSRLCFVGRRGRPDSGG